MASLGFAPGTAALDIVRGDSFREELVFAGLDWTDYTFEAEIRAHPDSPDLVRAVTVSAPTYLPDFEHEGEVVGGTRVVLSISSAGTQLDTEAPPDAADGSTRLAWDLKRLGGGLRDTVLRGPVHLKGSVTQ